MGGQRQRQIQNSNQDQDSIEQSSKQPEKQRWVILLIFCLLSFSSGSSQVLYSPIMEIAQIYFDVSEIFILWYNNIWPFTYLILGIPAMYSMMIWKLSTCLYISSFLNCFGSWIRYFAGNHYQKALFGTLITSLGQLWMSAAPAIIIQRWFPQNERQLATCIALSGNMMGVSMGYLYSSVYVQNDIKNLPKMQMYFACFMTLPFVLIVYLFKEKPKFFRNNIKINARLDFQQSIQTIIQPNNVQNLILLSMFVGVASTYQAIIQNIIKPLGYGTLDIGYIGLFMNSAGTLGGIISSILMDNQNGSPMYDLFLKFFIILETILCLVLMFTMRYYKDIIQWKAYLILSLIGLGQNAYIPFGVQAYMESVYPANEIVSMNAFFYASQFPAFSFVFLSTGGDQIMNAVIFPIFVYFIFFYKTDLLRYTAEQKIIAKYNKMETDTETQTQIEDL